MIQNCNYLGLKEASKMLRITETEVFELLKYGYLSSREINRRIHIPKDDIERYLKKFGQKDATDINENTGRVNRNFTISECVQIIGDEKSVHKLIQSSDLNTKVVNGQYVVLGKSLRKYLLGGKK